MFGREGKGSTGLASLSFFCGADLGKNRADVSRSIVSLGGAWRLNREAQTSFILVNQEFFSRDNMAIYSHHNLHNKAELKKQLTSMLTKAEDEAAKR